MTLEAADVGRRAGEQWLLRGLSCEIHPGDRIAVVGPSGSGKTVLLRLLALLDPPDAGQIRWQQTVPQGNEIPEFRSQVIYLHQRPVLNEGSVEENLQRPYSLQAHQPRRFSRPRIIDWLQKLGRDESFLAKQQRDLSGGEAQLTGLLRAIQLDPAVLLLDEPTSALDPGATRMVETLVGKWHAELPDQRAVVWVTHHREQLQRVAEIVWELEAGVLLNTVRR